jgi:hypothetical protein
MKLSAQVQIIIAFRKKKKFGREVIPTYVVV